MAGEVRVGLTNMRQFELTIVRFDPEPRLTHDTFESRRAAVAALTVPNEAECFVRVFETETGGSMPSNVTFN